MTSNADRIGLRYSPTAFTEHGILMLSSVLNSTRAVQVNIQIMRAFVNLRQMLSSNAVLSRRLDEREGKYGRELEIWDEAKDASKLQATAREMRKTWDAVRPSIEAKNPAVAKKFEGLVAQVEAAKAPADYAKVAKPVLDEVDNLEKVFE